MNIRYVDVKTAHGGKATVAEVEVHDDFSGNVVRASGQAFRHPDDKNDEELARMLATGRALQAAGRKLEKRANGLVKHHDDMKIYRVKQAKKPEATKPAKKKRRWVRKS